MSLEGQGDQQTSGSIVVKEVDLQQCHLGQEVGHEEDLNNLNDQANNCLIHFYKRT